MSNRWERLVEKYGGEDEARAEMRRRAEKSRRNKGGKGGFASMDKERLIEVASKGGNAERKPKDNAGDI